MDLFDDVIQQKPTKQYYISQIRTQLVPNYSQLEQQQQSQIDNVIQSLISSKDKSQLQSFMHKNLFEKTPNLRIHIWKSTIQIIVNSHAINIAHWSSLMGQGQKTKLIDYNTIIQRLFPSYMDEQDLLDIGSERTKIDEDLWHSVTLDTKRTHSALGCFQKQSIYHKIYMSKVTKQVDLMSRILYIWALTNPTVKYVQGMNQILAPLFYLEFYNESKISESEVFFMFCRIITFLIDMHIKQMDNFEHGIMGRMMTLNKYLKVVDIQLWNRLQTEGIYPQFYSFRWLALLLAQEFQLFDTILLWDFMLSFDGYRRFFFLYSSCLAILKLRKQFIMTNQFANALPSLQKLRNLPIKKLIGLAMKIYDKYSRIDMQKLYSKIDCNQDGVVKKLKQKTIKDEKNTNQTKNWSYEQLLKTTSNYLSKFYQK